MGRGRATAARVAARHAVDVADRLGAALRDARRKAGLTQADAARKAGISQSLWSQLESARSTGWTLLTWDRAAHAVGASFEAFIRGASAADQPRDIAHLKAQELVIRTSRAGLWASLPEQNIDRDARSSRAADVLLHRHIPPRPPEYGLIEVFDWFPDVGDPMRAWSSRLDAVERLAIARMGDDLPQVGGCWIVRATQRNRQLFNELAGIFTARFPGDPNAWLRALADPGSRMPKDAALLWVSVSGDRLFSRP